MGWAQNALFASFVAGASPGAIAEAPRCVVTVEDDLRGATVECTDRWPGGVQTMAAPGRRWGRAPPMLRPGDEPIWYPRGVDVGGTTGVEAWADGRPCEVAPVRRGDAVRIACAGAEPGARWRWRSHFAVPARFGLVGRHRGALRLLLPWHPPLPRRAEVVLAGARDRPVVLGGLPGRRRTVAKSPWLSVYVGPRRAVTRRIGQTARWLTAQPQGPRAQRIAATVADVVAFLAEERLWRPDDAMVLVDGAIRHTLAAPARGVLVVSDRLFRVTPVERLLRFHHEILARAILVQVAACRLDPDDPDVRVSAEIAGRWLLERYIQVRRRGRDSAEDLLGPWAFIPAVNNLLYAPDVPFAGDYFDHVPRTPEELVFARALPERAWWSWPDPWGRASIARGRLEVEASPSERAALLSMMLEGHGLSSALAALWGRTRARAWGLRWRRRPPDIRYGIGSVRRSPRGGVDVAVTRRGALGRDTTRVEVYRDGAPVSVKTLTTWAPGRFTVSATVASWDSVHVNRALWTPELPSEDDPSPRYDNRAPHRWRVLLNNFNVLLSASEGVIDTALDLGFSRVYDPRWRYGVRAAYTAQSISLAGRASYRWGRSVTADRLSSWLGVNGSGDFLRPGFRADAGSAWATSVGLFAGFDDRPSLWAPGAGHALRAAVTYFRNFGSPEPGVDPNSLRFSLRGLRAWRLGGLHQFAVRGSVAGILGRPRTQLLLPLGGRYGVRGYQRSADLGRARAILGAEWVHTLIPQLDENAFYFVWASRLDGALFADVAAIADDLSGLSQGASRRADVGYGVRLYLDYFGARPGVMAVDVAFALVESPGAAPVGGVAVYVDFAQSFEVL